MMNPRFAGGATTTTRTALLPFLAFVLILALICSSTSTIADVVPSPVDIQDISYRANVKVVPQKDFATLGTNGDKNLVILELNVQLDQKSKHSIQSTHPHSLLAANDNKVILEVRNQNKLYSANYEEIEHDITPQRIGTGASYDLNHNVLPIIRRREGVSTESYENCLYTGQVRGMKDSTVSISTCSGSLTGWINTPQGSFSIENTAEQHKLRQDAKSSTTGAYHGVQAFNTLSQQRVLAKNGDLHALSELVNSVQLVDVDEEQRRLKAHEEKVSGKTGVKTCAADHTQHQVPADTLLKIGYDHASLKRRQELLNQQVSSNQIKTLSDDEKEEQIVKKDRFLEVVLYHDYKRLQFFNTSEGMTMEDLMDEAREHSLEIFNNMVGFYKNSDFKQHNVHLILSGHVFFLNGDPYTKYLHRGGGLLVISGSGLLENFNKYRNYYGHKGDVGVLLSNYNFQSNIKGVANVGSLCSGPRYNGNINSVTYRNVALSSVLVAHEIGHVLSCNHDENDSRWIMYPYVVSATKFSPRSKRSADYHFSKTRCANNDPRQQQQYALGDGTSSTKNIGTLSLNDQHDDHDNQQQHAISYIYSDYAKRQDYHDKVDLDFLRDHAQEYSVLLDDHVGATTTTADYDDVIAEVIDDERYVNHNYQQQQQSATTFSHQLKSNNMTTLTTPSLLAAIILAAIGGSVLSVFTLAGLFICAKKSAILSNLFTAVKDEQLSASSAMTPNTANNNTTNTLQPRTLLNNNNNNTAGNLPNASPNRFAFTPKHTSIMNTGGDIPALNTQSSLRTTTNNNIATIDPPTPRGEYNNNYPASPSMSYSSTTRHRSIDSDSDGVSGGMVADGNNHSDLRPPTTHRVIFEDLTAD